MRFHDFPIAVDWILNGKNACILAESISKNDDEIKLGRGRLGNPVNIYGELAMTIFSRIFLAKFHGNGNMNVTVAISAWSLNENEIITE